MVRKLSNDLAQLDLKKIPGEDVAKLAEMVTEKARQIVGSGNPPPDLKHLVSKPFTTGSDQYFKTHALNVHNKVINHEYSKTWEQMLQEHSHTYQDLVQQADYGPAKGVKDQDDSIHAMIGKLEQKIDGLQTGVGASNVAGGRRCYKCGSPGHVIRDCPEGGSKKDTNPRFVPPNTNKGEPKEKVVDGVKQIWCGKCRNGKGIWTIGDRAHHTHEHRGSNPNDEVPPESPPKDANAAQSKNPQANVGYIDAPLTFGFLGWHVSNDDDDDDVCDEVLVDLTGENNPLDEDYPKEFCGEL